MCEVLKYDIALDEYTQVVLDEFEDSAEEDRESTKTSDTVLIFRKGKRSKSRSTFVNFFSLTRVISKSGRVNTFLTKLSHKNLSYIKDLGNTLLAIRWRWILITLVLVNFACFFIFGWLWWIMALNSGDFVQNNTEVCVVNANTLTGYMLLSVETITTIGYGYRYPTESCKGGWAMLMMQALLNVAIQGALVSIVYVKISKPFTKLSASIFSKNAVICLRDGKLRFIFRIHDFHRKIWCATNISLYFMDKEQTFVGYQFKMMQMVIEPHGLLIFPLEIEHVIDENSPLWTFRPLDILQAKFEIIAVAEGSSHITGQVSQNRTSYSSSDVFWGHRFKPCINYDDSKDSYMVDFKKFKQTVPFDTPLCSAKKVREIQCRLGQLAQDELEQDK